jgi:hypothetical protein
MTEKIKKETNVYIRHERLACHSTAEKTFRQRRQTNKDFEYLSRGISPREAWRTDTQEKER